MFTLTFAFVLAAAIAAFAVYLIMHLRRETARHMRTEAELEKLTVRFRGVQDADAERQRVLGELEQERLALQENLRAAERDAMLEQERLTRELETERTRIAREMQEARQRLESDRDRANAAIHAERERVASEIRQAREVSERALQTVQLQRATAEGTIASLHTQIAALRAQFEALDEESNLQSFGFYKPHYAFASSGLFEQHLETVREWQKRLLKDKRAATCATEWTVNGSAREGKKQINQTLRLMLRAFNGESDAAIAKVRYNNVHVMEARIEKAYEVINGCAEVQSCTISSDYRLLKLQELHLVHELEEKRHAEKEEQRRIREQMRDEEIALRQLEKVRLEAEKDEQRFQAALAKARADVELSVGAKHERLVGQIAELERRLAAAHDEKERAIARAQLTRSGHVYVISNVGGFGEQVYKIGMTRRLDPLERIYELGDASVPFDFDVHAIIYCEDAPTLENRLHRVFNDRRVNRVNERKEFFRVAIEEIGAAVRECHGVVQFTLAAEAEEYHKTVSLLEQERALAIVADAQRSEPQGPRSSDLARSPGRPNSAGPAFAALTPVERGHAARLTTILDTVFGAFECWPRPWSFSVSLPRLHRLEPRQRSSWR